MYYKKYMVFNQMSDYLKESPWIFVKVQSTIFIILIYQYIIGIDM